MSTEDDVFMDEPTMDSLTVFPEPDEKKLKIERVVEIKTGKFYDVIEGFGCSTMDVKKAIEHWVTKQPIPDLTERIDDILKDYDEEVGIKRKERLDNEMGTEV